MRVVNHKKYHRKKENKLSSVANNSSQDIYQSVSELKTVTTADLDNKDIIKTQQTVVPVEVDIPFLRNLYSIPSEDIPLTSGSSLSQSVFETAEEYFSSNDLIIFENKYNLPQQDITIIGGYTTTLCKTNNNNNVNSCYEGNLDVQYLTGIASSNIPTSVRHINSNADSNGVYPNPFLNWILDVVNDSNPPTVNSISWGSNEKVSQYVYI